MRTIRKNGKTKVVLSESEVRAIVRKSINEVLDSFEPEELDWVSDKMRSRGHMDNADRVDQMARDKYAQEEGPLSDEPTDGIAHMLGRAGAKATAPFTSRLKMASFRDNRPMVNEIGDSDKGQDALGRCHAREAMRSYEQTGNARSKKGDEIYKYAENARKKAQNGDDHTHPGYPDDEEKPLKKAYNKGYQTQYNKEFKNRFNKKS